MNNLNSRKKSLVINALIFAALFGLVSLNKEYLRPGLVNIAFANTLTGCFPNFIAAYLISLAFVSRVLIREAKFGRMIVITSSLLVFLILTIEELKPMWGASTYYDLFDILASGLGSFLAFMTFEALNVWRKRKTKI